ncbi:hypothetical protein [Streptomyces specialis]|uniref:hypothetical protein n=1 Tax=Streptomyces specialis TaxID=498367 RepID=UPI00073EECF6|nr:hypothetical protein [Streptomyces specialis]
MAVPEGYDTGQGWQSDLAGTRYVLPGTPAVAVFTGEETAEGGFTVLDAADGTPSWTSAPVRAVEEDGTVHSLTVSTGDADHLVAWSTGTSGADAVSRGEEIVSLDIFPATGSGEAVEPAHHIEIDGSGTVTDGGAAVLVTGDDGVAVAVDPATGERTTYDPETLDVPDGCDDCPVSGEIIGVTEAGPLLVDSYGYSGFWVPGAWSSGTARPENAAEDSAFVDQVTDTALVARWYGKEGSSETVWAVLDGATGETRATVRCPETYGANDTPAEDENQAVSADGRYLAYGHRVFDLEEGTGHCFAETENTNPVRFFAVTDDGRAFGLAGTDEGDAPVELDIASGEFTEMAAGTSLPLAHLPGMGVFTEETVGTLVAYPIG